MKPYRPALLSAVLAAASIAACAGPPPRESAPAAAAESSIRALLERQQSAWNAGDVDAFLVGYDESPHLMFVSGADVERGFEETRARYHRRYDTPKAMGTLSFGDIDVRVLAPDAAVATGAWELARDHDRPHGRFTLLLRRRAANKWVIVLDHTSAASPPES